MLCIMDTSWKFESYTVFPLVWETLQKCLLSTLPWGITGDMHSMCN